MTLFYTVFGSCSYLILDVISNLLFVVHVKQLTILTLFLMFIQLQTNNNKTKGAVYKYENIGIQSIRLMRIVLN